MRSNPNLTFLQSDELVDNVATFVQTSFDQTDPLKKVVVCQMKLAPRFESKFLKQVYK